MDGTVMMRRESWIDIAKGVAICLVAFHHSLQIALAYGWDDDFVSMLNRLFETLRMPLFFTVSGALAANTIRSSSFYTLFQKKLLLLIWLYFFWCVVRSVWFSFVEWPFGDLNPLRTLLLSPVLPWSGLWYLYGLVVYMALAWCLRKQHVLVQLGLGVFISLGFSSGVFHVPGSYTWTSIGTYFLFFLCGVQGKELINFFARRQSLLKMILMVVLFCALTFLLHKISGAPRVLLKLLVSFVAVATGISISVIFSQFPRLFSWVENLGHHTLAIYVVHVLAISVIIPMIPINIVPLWLLVPAVAALSIAVSLGMRVLLGRVDGVYSLPRLVSQRFQRE